MSSFDKLASIHPKENAGASSSNIEDLGLNLFYNEHKDYVKDIIEKTASYNEDYKKTLLDSFQASDHSLMSVHDFV